MNNKESNFIGQESLILPSMKRDYQMKFPIAFIVILVLALGCQKPPKDTLTSGEIYIACDEEFKPVIEEELKVFHNDYPDAKIHAIYTTEAECVDLLLRDSVRLAVIGRKLTSEEEQVILQAEITPRYKLIFYDAVVMVLNPHHPKWKYTVEEIRSMLGGYIKTWRELDPSLSEDSIEIYVANENSSVVKYLIDSVLQGGTLSDRVYQTGSIDSVIEYVSKRPMAVGFVPLCWVSDKDEQTVNQFLDKLLVAAIKKSDTTDYVPPYQFYIYNRSYPFIRPIYIAKREPRNGLGTGFEAFVAGDKGQRIILTMDLLPAQAPIRVVEVKEDNIQEKSDN